MSDTMSFGIAQSASSCPRLRKTCWAPDSTPAGAEAAQVVLELLLALRLGGGGGDRLRDDAASRGLGRRPLADALPAQALLEEREPAQAGRRGGREGARPAAGSDRSAHHLDGAGADHLRLAEVGRARAGSGRGRRRAGRPRRAPSPTARRKAEQLLVLDEVELADHAELVERVEEQVHERAGPAAAACCRSAQPWISAAAPSTGASANTATESATMSGGTRSSRYWSISSRAARSSAGVSGRAESGGAEGAGRRLVGGGVGGPRRRRLPRRRPPRPPAGPAASPPRPRSAPAGFFESARITTVARPGGRSGATSASGSGLAVDHREEDRGDGGAGERALPGEHLVEHRAEREDVGPRRGPLALGLLRGHVVGRAHDDAGRRPVLAPAARGRSP